MKGAMSMERKIIERWGMMEIALPGKTKGNPFVDYTIRGQFTGAHESVTVAGFYNPNSNTSYKIIII